MVPTRPWSYRNLYPVVTQGQGEFVDSFDISGKGDVFSCVT